MWFIEIISLSIEKRHADFEQSSTSNLSPGNSVVRSPGDNVITFVLGLDCAPSRKTWVNRLYDYKDGRLREWRKCFLIVVCSLSIKKKLWWKFSISWEYLQNREIGRLLLKLGASRSNREGWNVRWQFREWYSCVFTMLWGSSRANTGKTMTQNCAKFVRKKKFIFNRYFVVCCNMVTFIKIFIGGTFFCHPVYHQHNYLDHTEAIKWVHDQEDAANVFYALEATKHLDFNVEPARLFMDKTVFALLCITSLDFQVEFITSACSFVTPVHFTSMLWCW